MFNGIRKIFGSPKTNIQRDSEIVWSDGSLTNFDFQWKVDEIVPILDEINKDGKFRKRWVDFGSGGRPISWYLSGSTETHDALASGARKLVTLDAHVSALFHPYGYQHVQFDITRMDDFQKRVIEPNKTYFGIDENDLHTEQIDTMFFFDILNYVDYQNTLLNAARYLKRGGYFVILNGPDRYPNGSKNAASRNMTSTDDVRKFLESQGFEIELEKDADTRRKHVTHNKRTALFVARKR